MSENATQNDPTHAYKNKADEHHDTVDTKDPSKLSEADFLLRQQDDAKAAIGATVSEMADKLKEVVDLRLWTQHYPLIATGIAAGAGFVAALTLVPKDKAEAKRKWDTLKHAFTGGPGKLYDAHGNEYVDAKPEPRPPAVELRSDPPPAPKPGWLATLVQEAIKTIRPAIVSFITAGVAAKSVEEGPPQGAAAAAGSAPQPDPSAGGTQYS